MKKLHRINLIVLWICALSLIAFLTLSRGLTEQTVKSDLCMAACIMIITVLYFSKANDVIKGSGITVIIALGCLLASISEGGNDATFILSFILLGVALIYFNKKIIVTFLAVYIPACIAAGLINPAYVAGPGANLTQSMEYVAAYAVVGVLMVIATERGGSLIRNSRKMFERISSDAKTNGDVIKQLNAAMEDSCENMGSLTVQIQGISDAARNVESLTGNMNVSASALKELIGEAVKALNENEELNIELGKRFDEVSLAVHSGSEGALEVKKTLDSMKETVLAAGEATQVLFGKIGSVGGILKEINKITMRTGMLSINASIEAAKAGANGKGFAVVAEEIKSLADESNQSSRGIEQIISELTAQVDDVAKKSSAGTKAAIEGTESLNVLLSTLDNIRNANDIVISSATTAGQNNNIVNGKIENAYEEIGSLALNVAEISRAVESVSAEIYRQNASVKNVNGEIGKMKAVTGMLRCEENA